MKSKAYFTALLAVTIIGTYILSTCGDNANENNDSSKWETVIPFDTILQ